MTAIASEDFAIVKRLEGMLHADIPAGTPSSPPSPHLAGERCAGLLQLMLLYVCCPEIVPTLYQLL
ncbi:hypothetical protein ACIBO5_12710 [Nonomuraea angiospora]|uniref:hypothetical protein n=1 Tax=Nonomuraea angiospora TaxID=46172 RepID=UPI0037B57989